MPFVQFVTNAFTSKLCYITTLIHAQDGVTVANSDRILLVGATNRYGPHFCSYFTIVLCRPQEIDEAARRRLVKRLYIPLPDAAARKQIVKNLMQQQPHSLSDDDINNISQQTDGKIVGYCPQYK